MQSPHDALFRFTFAQAEHARSLLLALVQAPVRDAVDWSELRSASEISTDTGLSLHLSDRLAVAGLRRVPDAHALFLFEHKSVSDPDLVRQLTRYVVHIERQWRREHATWPFVVPVVVHHGSQPMHRDVATAAGVDPAVARALSRFRPRLRFLCLDLTRCSEEDLRRRNLTPLACVTLLFLQSVPRLPDDGVLAALDRWGDLLRGVEAGMGGQQAMEALSSYLLYTTNLTSRAIDETFARILRKPSEDIAMSTADKLLAQGRTEGLKEGRTEGRVAMLLRQLAARFGTVPDAIADRLREATADDLDRWAIAILDAKSIGEVFARD